MHLVIASALLVWCCVTCGGSDIYHQKSRTVFYPDKPSSYFGYSVVLSNSSLIVGAPKAVSRVKDSRYPGQVLTCRTDNLDKQNVTCYPLGMDDSDHDKSIRRIITVPDFFRNDMWFGATIATIPDGKLIACAPRWTDPYKDSHLLAKGACYVETRNRGITLIPLMDRYRLAFQSDGARKEYGEYGTHLNFFAYGQAGMSIKVTKSNSIIIGAPGLMQWTGGIIDYKFTTDPNSLNFQQQPISNPYFTRELAPDDYFGYSVESGTFHINGSVLYVAGAPRAKLGYGQVLIFKPPVQEHLPLNIRARVKGTQLGSYFGASLCCTDLNGDGRDDLLVGAPNFIMTKDEMPYDQGAVFVYLADGKEPTLVFKDVGYVFGSGDNGARFGSSIATLGDIDGDGHSDVAIGAPWENDGMGAVYIYKGSSEGLKKQYVQRLIDDNARGFGMSISKGLDVDGNNCSDLAIGAHDSSTAYIYRCIPTIQVHSSIKVPDAMNLPKNVTSFSALFCINVPKITNWPHVKLDLKATITVDPDNDRASVKDEPDFKVTARPGSSSCNEQIIEVKPTADLSKPILITMELQPTGPLIDDIPTFVDDAARMSEDSILRTSFLIQLVRDCGDDLICTPSLKLNLQAIESEYVPGLSKHLGVKVKVSNEEEPAYGTQVILHLPSPPKRVPRFCSLQTLIMTCNIKAPLGRGEFDEFDVEFEDTFKGVDKMILKVEAELKHPLYIRNDNEKAVKDVSILVVPKASFKVSGKTLQNSTLSITREKFEERENVSFSHYFEITNLGPSDWSTLKALLIRPQNVSFQQPINGCADVEYPNISCAWSIPANTSVPVALSLKYDLEKYGTFLEDMIQLNITSEIILLTTKQESFSVTTTLVLDPKKPIWPYIVAAIVSAIIGLALLGGIVYGLKKYGFFSRTKYEELKRIQEEATSEHEDIGDVGEPGCSTSLDSGADQSTQELLNDSE